MVKGFLIVSIAILTAVPAAQAVLVTGTSGTLFNSGGFENQTAPDNNPSNGILPGDWDTKSEENTDDIAVLTGGSPGAYEGNNYLRIRRNGGVSATIWAEFGAQQTGGTIHAEWMTYIPTPSNNTAHIVLSNGTGGEGTAEGRAGLLSRSVQDGSGNYELDRFNPSTSDWGFSGIRYRANEWQKWELDVNLTAETYTVTVAGNTSAALPFSTSGNTAVHLVFRGGGDGVGPYYLDGVPVPEPMAGGMLALGAIALAARRKH